MENYNKNKESSYIQYLDANPVYGWAMSQKLPVNNLKWLEDTSKIDEEFIKNYNENSSKGYILEVDINILENYTTYIVIYHSYLKE